MSSASKSQVVYIETNNAGKPCYTLAKLATEVAHTAHLDSVTWHYAGINNRPAAGRRKVKITVTVEDI